MQVVVTNVRDNLPEWLRWVHTGLSLVLIWLGIAQLGLLTQGWDLVRRGMAPGSESLPEPKVTDEAPGEEIRDLPPVEESEGDEE